MSVYRTIGTLVSLYSTVSSGLNAIYCSYISLFTVQYLQASMPYIAHIYISLYSTAPVGLNVMYCSYISLFTVQHLQASMPYIAHIYLSLQYSIFRPQCHILLIYISLLQYSIFRPQCHILLIYTRAVPKCRIIVVKVSQTERYSFEILHA